MTYFTVVVFFRALTLSSPEVRFHIDSETHDPIDLQTKELMWAFKMLIMLFCFVFWAPE